MVSIKQSRVNLLALIEVLSDAYGSLREEMMSRIRFHDTENTPWMEVPEHSSDIRMHEMGDAQSLQMYEVKMAPDAVTENHAHEQDEIIYVVSGELRMGRRVLRAGDSVFIAGGSVYGFTAGPEGLHLINFRPRNDTSYMTSEDVLAQKRMQ